MLSSHVTGQICCIDKVRTMTDSLSFTYATQLATSAGILFHRMELRGLESNRTPALFFLMTRNMLGLLSLGPVKVC